MNKVILSVFAVLFAAADCQAAGFALNAGSPALVLKAAGNAAVPVPPASKPERARTGRYVQVSGHLALSGNAWMPQNGGYTSVNLNGWATFRDGLGQISSNNTYVSAYAGVWLRPNQHVSQSVTPNVSVQFYRGGKAVGSANLTGFISVSGWPGSSGMVMLNGSGQLTGSIYVEDEQ